MELLIASIFEGGNYIMAIQKKGLFELFSKYSLWEIKLIAKQNKLSFTP